MSKKTFKCRNVSKSIKKITKSEEYESGWCSREYDEENKKEVRKDSTTDVWVVVGKCGTGWMTKGKVLIC